MGACAVTTPQAQATVITSGPLNLVVPQTVDGIYLNLVTGATGTTSSAVAGYDFNPYASSTSATGLFSSFFTGTATTGNAGLLNGTAYALLGPGAVIGPTGTFTTGSTATLEAGYRAGVADAFFGIHFLNESTNVLNYGYVELMTTGTTGFPARILSYGYDNTGAAITTPALTGVPEPTTNVALGLGVLALGAVAVRRLRKEKRLVA